MWTHASLLVFNLAGGGASMSGGAAGADVLHVAVGGGLGDVVHRWLALGDTLRRISTNQANKGSTYIEDMHMGFLRRGGGMRRRAGRSGRWGLGGCLGCGVGVLPDTLGLADGSGSRDGRGTGGALVVFEDVDHFLGVLDHLRDLGRFEVGRSCGCWG